MRKKITAAVTAAIMAVSAGNALAAETIDVTNNYDLGSFTRQMEKLDRGLVAMKVDGGIYLSWRLMNYEDSHLGTAKKNVLFNIYRDGSLISTETETTNFIDENGNMESVYKVAPVVNGEEGEMSKEVTAFQSQSNYFDIPLQRPDPTTVEVTGYDKVKNDDGSYSFVKKAGDEEYDIGDCSTGDLDGDGEYEIIVKWDCNPQDNSNSGITGNVLLDAYKLDGTMLWRIDLGRNIRAGAHYTQFLVYDLDGDGKAEMCCKTAPGSIDSTGAYVTDASLDEEVRSADNEANYVSEYGFITEGPEYYTVFDSEGKAMDTIKYLYSRDSGSGFWGNDSAGRPEHTNRVDRFLGAIAYLDGVHPAAVTWRGYYDRTTAAAYTLENGRLKLAAKFDTDDIGKTYLGQGNHNITVADVDGDGKDEVITGALCLDDDFSIKWCSGRGHGDALHIGDYDPTHPGFEYFSVHESGGYTITQSTTSSQGKAADYGMTVYDAATGEEIAHYSGGGDTGRGVMANVGAGGYYQFWGAGTYKSMGNGRIESTKIRGNSSNFRIFWDGNLNDELLDGVGTQESNMRISAWNGEELSEIFTTENCVSLNSTKNNPSLQADILGDWREELIMARSDSEALRVYTTNIPTAYKMQTLMHDSVYRAGVAAEQTAYNQPPHVGFYMDDEVFSLGIAKVELHSGPFKTVYKSGEEFDSEGLSLEVEYEDGTSSIVDTGFDISGFDTYNASKQLVTVSYKGVNITIEITVTTDFTAEGSMLTGYNGSEKTVSLPEIINGENISSIAGNAFANIEFEKITVPESIVSIGENAFNPLTVIKCYKGSKAHEYALENSLNVELIESVIESFADVDYNSYEDQSIVQIEREQKVSKDSILYRLGGRANRDGSNGGDGKTGFVFKTENENGIVQAAVGRFADRGRNASMSIEGAPEFDASSTYVMSFDLNFNTPEIDGMDIQAVISDDSLNIDARDGSLVTDGCITSLTKSGLGISYDTWYNYTIAVQKGAVYQMVRDMDGNIISISKFANNVAMIPSKISFIAYGTTPGNRQQAYMSIDNFRMYTAESAVTNVNIHTKDSFGNVLSNIPVEIAGQNLVTDSNGLASVMLPSDLYQVKAVSPVYGEYDSLARVKGSEYTLNIVFSAEVPTGITAEVKDNTLTVKNGSLDGKLTIDINNPVNEAAEITVVYALYDKDGNLMGTKIDNGVSIDAGQTGTYTVESEYFDNTAAADNIKVYIWSDVYGRMVPLTNMLPCSVEK